MYEFKLPDIGEGLHEAELLEWDVKVGDTVAEGDPLAQVSTDKVNVELPSPCAGVIVELPWQPGDVIAVGQVLARIDDGTGGEAAVAEEPGTVRPTLKVRQGTGAFKIRAAPAVRRYAAEKGVDLWAVIPTGPNESVLKEDIDAYFSGRKAVARSILDDLGADRKMKLSGPRLAAAKHLELSSRIPATSSMTFEVEADFVVAECERLSKESEADRISPLAVIARCVCLALVEHPNFNAVIVEDERGLILGEIVNLGIAVDSEDGLLVPVIRGAQQMSAREMAAAIADRAGKARAGELAVNDFRGSTFTVSSTGSLEAATITGTTPVINFPNVATLWVSRIRERPRVVEGKLEVGPMMSATLAFDHRYLHGADATRFVNTLVSHIIEPPTE
jgi:pyruvate dehydrogenase E2 component (dihydrolipoamide acetyltransferase)